MELKFSKEKQLKKNKPKKEGSKKEAPVQNFINSYLKLNHIDYFRVPDSFWKYIHNPYNKIKIHIKKMCSDAFAGWPDNMIFVPLTEKYLLCLPLEAKSKTGRLNGNKQRNMAKQLNYQIPRSPEKAKKMIDTFIEDLERYKKLIEDSEKK